ncbi:MAG: hypothetical protein HFJ10_07740 [Lachnospiraceae bacterium]|jgi:hypothetical protein|nr:hypothetical protein [Lachnospiraceae bacterium]
MSYKCGDYYKEENRGDVEMTWERFKRTGAVEDYLLYKGIDWNKMGDVCVPGMGHTKSRGVAEHGTDDYSDGHGTGCVSLW